MKKFFFIILCSLLCMSCEKKENEKCELVYAIYWPGNTKTYRKIVEGDVYLISHRGTNRLKVGGICIEQTTAPIEIVSYKKIATQHYE